MFQEQIHEIVVIIPPTQLEPAMVAFIIHQYKICMNSSQRIQNLHVVIQAYLMNRQYYTIQLFDSKLIFIPKILSMVDSRLAQSSRVTLDETLLNMPQYQERRLLLDIKDIVKIDKLKLFDANQNLFDITKFYNSVLQF
ncbi:Hypothetical_protein [Hexamita inflata]|uniref:Hypothetical_protein n=1 Tax=Hexamita inflata TaxID=28002 RepID=A0AA86R2G6_9EUKA|nr:Hypothetical protein HINF_LOCUS58129 [Hexamita inflata]